MRQHYFITNIEPHQGSILLQDKAVCKQITSVLRLGVGDEIVLGDGVGLRAVCTIAAIERTQIVCTVITSTREPAPAREIRVAAAITKRDTFEWTVQKTTEIGVTRITPLRTDRTIKLGANLERLAAIAREAAEQSGRAYVPVIDPPMTIDELTATEQSGFWCELDATTPATVLHEAPSCVVAIGPEGGWSAQEREAFATHNWTPVLLAPTVLRAETAAIVAVTKALL